MKEKLIIDKQELYDANDILMNTKLCKENYCDDTECPLADFCSAMSNIVNNAERIMK